MVGAELLLGQIVWSAGALSATYQHVCDMVNAGDYASLARLSALAQNYQRSSALVGASVTSAHAS